MVSISVSVFIGDLPRDGDYHRDVGIGNGIGIGDLPREGDHPRDATCPKDGVHSWDSF